MEPGGLVAFRKVPGVGSVAEVAVDHAGDQKDVPHHPVLVVGAGATGSEHIGVGEIEAPVAQHTVNAHRRIDLPHARHVQGDPILHVELVVRDPSFDLVGIATLAVGVVVVLRLSREIPCHLPYLELRQDQHLDRNGKKRLPGGLRGKA